MTMSVGLGRIVNDPSASVLVRKALGALSTPGLLVHDTSLYIDDGGRITLRLKEDGGLIQDEDGLYLEITVGIDSHVDLVSSEYDRDWNAYLTGTAPNYMESGLAIGAEDLTSTTTAAETFFGLPDPAIQTAKVNITTIDKTHLRLSYDRNNFVSHRITNTGVMETWCTGTFPGFHIYTGDGSQPYNTAGFVGGLSLNGGATIEQITTVTGSIAFTGGGALGSISWQEHTISFTPGTGQDVRPAQDHVTVVPLSSSTLPTEWISWCVRISATNQFTVRIAWFDITGADTRDWLFMVHRML